MCPDCFLNEFTQFESEKSFEEFMEIMKSKKSIIHIGEVPDDYGKPVLSLFGFHLYGSKTKRGYSVFKCQSCSQKWKLDAPDYAWRGFFLKLEEGPAGSVI